MARERKPPFTDCRPRPAPVMAYRSPSRIARSAFSLVELLIVIVLLSIAFGIVAGVAVEDLRRGPGHFPETPLPGQLGNAAIAGHRTTYGQPFRNVDDLVPGDEIIGFVTRGRGVSVHRADCANAAGLTSQSSRLIEVEWDGQSSGSWVVSIQIEALDRSKLLRDVAEGRALGDTTTLADASVVEEIKRQLQAEMGLMPVRLLRERRESFVELNAVDNFGKTSYGTAGYLGNGYFITVKHGVVALGQENASDPRRIVSVKLMHKGQSLPARVIDAGDAKVEVDPGDWAILKVKDPVDIPALTLNLDYGFDFADPIFRLGNDYSKGIILSTGYVGQRTTNGLVTCLTDGHPGVSGGGVLDQDGELVGIPIGRMQGDYRFSFILPLRAEMFRKVPGLGAPVQANTN